LRFGRCAKLLEYDNPAAIEGLRVRPLRKAVRTARMKGMRSHIATLIRALAYLKMKGREA